MTFLDSLTGFAATNSNSNNQSYILLTTNGGDNWNIQITTYPNFNKIIFVDKNIGFASAYTNALFKTTNGGINWFTQSNSGIFPQDMAVLNKDTILFVRDSGFDGGVYRTTDGGLNWQPLGQVGGTGQPFSIYMFDKNLGFTLGTYMRRTTNGGENWFIIPNENYWGIQLIDSLRGWKTVGAGIKITTNGGLNWVSQQLPNLPNAYSGTNLFAINKDTVWMIGNEYYYGLLYKTTNGGLNWGYQFADTSVQITLDHFINFVSAKTGWASSSYFVSEIHTKIGGNDTSFFTSINKNNSIIPADFILYQNYPNPFNATTKIKYQINKGVRSQESGVRIAVYDIVGKQITILENENKKPGDYEIIFDGSNQASGIYFYSFFADGVRVDTKKMLLIK
jgi:photosystem II stability/assembly factor-like uncharacterized protein